MIATIVLNRCLEPAARGQVALMVLWPTLAATLIIGGWSAAMLREIGRNPGRSRSVWISSIATSGLLSVVTMCIFFILLPILISGPEETLIYASWYLWYIPLGLLINCSMTVLEGLGCFHLTGILRTGYTALYVSTLAVLATTESLHPDTYIFAILGALVVWAIGSLLVVSQVAKGPYCLLVGDMPRYALRATPLVWISLMHQRLDQVMLCAFMPADVAGFGIYVAVAAIGSLPATIARGLALVLLPASARGQPDGAGKLWLRMGRAYVLVWALLAIPMLLTVPQVLAYGFGPKYASGGLILYISVFASLPAGLLSMSLNTLLGMGLPKRACLAGGIAFVASVCIGGVLLWRIGPAGMALGQLAGFTLGVWVSFKVVPGIREIKVFNLLPGLTELSMIRKSVRKFSSLRAVGRLER